MWGRQHGPPVLPREGFQGKQDNVFLHSPGARLWRAAFFFLRGQAKDWVGLEHVPVGAVGAGPPLVAATSRPLDIHSYDSRWSVGWQL